MIKLDLPFTPPTFLDVSGLCAFRRCEARYAFRYLLGLKLPDPAPALDYGSAIHCAMPFLQRGDLAGALKAFSDSWASSGNEPDAKRNLLCGAEMLTRWHRERFVGQTIPYEIIEPPKTGVGPETRYSDQEYAFCVSLGDDSLNFAGRTDALARAKNTKRLWVVEYKTTSELSDRFVRAFSLSPQLLGYAAAASILTGDTVEGAYLEALRVTSANPDNMCLPISIQEHSIDAFISLFKSTSRQICNCCSSCCFEQDFSACAPYAQFGSQGYLCEYSLLCQTFNWQSVLSAYSVSHWKPFVELELIQKEVPLVLERRL